MKTIVTSQLSPQWLCGNSCTWAHDVYIYIYKHGNNVLPVITTMALWQLMHLGT